MLSKIRNATEVSPKVAFVSLLTKPLTGKGKTSDLRRKPLAIYASQ